VPEEDNEHANNIPGVQYVLGYKIIDEEWHDLCQTLEMLSNQASIILANIPSASTCHI
jgi:hypothetical protein